MKAAVCYEFGKPLVVEEVEIDTPRANEVKVRTVATAICRSDIRIIKGEAGGKLPIVVGHESAGYVEEVGKNVTSVKPGDAVVVSLLSSCRHCYYCVNGYPHMCVNYPFRAPRTDFETSADKISSREQVKWPVSPNILLWTSLSLSRFRMISRLIRHHCLPAASSQASGP